MMLPGEPPPTYRPRKSGLTRGMTLEVTLFPAILEVTPGPDVPGRKTSTRLFRTARHGTPTRTGIDHRDRGPGGSSPRQSHPGRRRRAGGTRHRGLRTAGARRDAAERAHLEETV
ncbi:hypothetical protein D187_009978 [Cystobacter fuscus DSM 2262]|uniref:Uncharacterized protein n=1 Tax=Cystobacter fuscus (strain ATCC 25194 / DSM 2262 / NBRC 100088 / M29) TaxID=1242864 RepID=S9QLD2_CYSF2|nr:hypothetical protein D187_009978 [Cystobacter fuscus DSM 2262]